MASCLMCSSIFQSPFLMMSIVFLFLVYTAAGQTGLLYECDDILNCDARGVCYNDDANGEWFCICDDGYTTYPEPDVNAPDEDRVYCQYEQRSQLVAFLLSWFFGFFGGGHWYLGLFGYAGAKLAYGVISCFGPCVIMCFCGGMGLAAVSANSRHSDNVFEGFMAAGGSLSLCCFCCLYMGAFVWWLVDIIRFGQNMYEDSNGVSLEPW